MTAIPLAVGEIAILNRALVAFKMHRVARPGAPLIVAESDMETAVLDGADPTTSRTIWALHCASLRHGTIGRQMPRLFKTVGLAEVTVEPYTQLWTDPVALVERYRLRPLVARAVETGVLAAAAVRTWWDDLAQAGREGGCCSPVPCSSRAG